MGSGSNEYILLNETSDEASQQFDIMVERSGKSNQQFYIGNMLPVDTVDIQ